MPFYKGINLIELATGSFNPGDDMEYRTVLLAFCSQPNQIPASEDEALTVSWDTIVTIDTDYVTLTNDTTGRQSLITFQDFSNTSVNVAFDYQKSGGFFSTSEIFGRRLINGSQSGTTVEKQLDVAESRDNFVDSFSLSFDAGDTLQYDFAYLGDESGLAQNAVVPTGFGVVPCSAIRISRIFTR